MFHVVLNTIYKYYTIFDTLCKVCSFKYYMLGVLLSRTSLNALTHRFISVYIYIISKNTYSKITIELMHGGTTMKTKLESFFQYQGIALEDIPKIPLYMDQLLSLFDDYFSDFRRDEDEKIMTKTMINNYVKAKVITPPVKKKYSKEQLMLLALVYKLKNILAMSDVKGFFDLYDAPELSEDERNRRIEEYFMIYNAIELEHIGVLNERYKNFKATLTEENDKKALVARLLVEADLNKRLALMLLDEEKEEAESKAKLEADLDDNENAEPKK